MAVARVESVQRLEDAEKTEITTFRVVEQFGNYREQTFTTKIANACCLCGMSFELDESYLVYVYPSDGGYFTTSICSRTKRADRASDEIDAIRQFKVNK